MYRSPSPSLNRSLNPSPSLNQIPSLNRSPSQSPSLRLILSMSLSLNRNPSPSPSRNQSMKGPKEESLNFSVSVLKGFVIREITAFDLANIDVDLVNALPISEFCAIPPAWNGFSKTGHVDWISYGHLIIEIADGMASPKPVMSTGSLTATS
eukprot:jgi/Tetstr1/449705/TSEL_036773.t1